ncbi:adenosine deaminase [Candidatus Enterococcus clewellii]|uniref:Adenosine deaminase n=1 Tax=Candidatus Enterococcus clewellii TaxID=1834193 RepID=A0A242K5Q8_9ENTE|nr:adenosine deaminase [Enterococcus sp. 9E7_DIV0242]OTP14484.1 adenosine deaminase [Enterococcus sp. 9E7_DIV0242]
MEKEIVIKLPKIELHCHLDGSVSVETLLKISRNQSFSSQEDSEQLRKAVTAPKDCRNLKDYLTCFDVILTYLQTETALEMATLDVIAQAARDGISYIELRFAPTQHLEQGLSLTQVVTAVLKGLNAGEKRYGVKSNAILCGMRHDELEKIEAVVHLAKYFQKSGVVAFDLAGDEAAFPPREFEETLALANQLSIPLTLHAGECGCGKNVADSISLGAKRIGHGIALKDTPEYFDLLREKDVLLELCPTSNFQTKTVESLADYPFRQFLKEKIKVCINTDNRTVSNTTLVDEYMKLSEWYQLTYDEMEQLNHDAVDGAFISDEEKAALHQLLTKKYRELTKNGGLS